MVLLPLAAAGLLAGATPERIEVVSTLDGSVQPSYLFVPDAPSAEPRPLLVSLHTWSGDLEQRNPALTKLALDRGWLVLLPDFRGRNDHPEACGSLLAQQDILDAVAQVAASQSVDRRRIYLAGTSGGGHMTMLMAGRHPEIWAAASAWVGISDLAAWYRKHAGQGYGRMLVKCCGGEPGDSQRVDAEYRDRSPVTWLAAATRLPLDLAAGVHDGHKGSVPVRQTIDAFNVVARAVGGEPVSEEEIAQISRPDGRLDHPLASDQVTDPTFGRAIHLRRQAGLCRVTIFEGGHEGLAKAAIEFLAQHVKPVE